MSRSRTGGARPAAVAGRFYPDSPDRLRYVVAGHLAGAGAGAPDPRLAGIVVPHAGLIYSGPVAAAGYRLIDPPSFDRVVLLGPAHYRFVAGIAVSSANAWSSPLGVVPVDQGAGEHLVSRGLARIDDEAHEPEHCLEVQLPFLQLLLQPGWTMTPLLVGHAAPDVVTAVVRASVTPGTLLVVSTDLSHYLPYDEARAVDEATALHIVRLDVEAIGDRDACGAYALRGALAWARHDGLAVRQLDLRNSGDTAGSHDRVVGYGGFAIRRAERE